MLEINKFAIERDGYLVCSPAFEENEFAYIRESIDKQYSNIIKKQNIPTYTLKKHLKDEFKFCNYHKISNYINHSYTWPKESRVLPEDFTSWFLKTSYIKFLEDKYGEIEITDEDCLGYPNLYWRLVRPNIIRDVGELHRDSWFWEIDKLKGKYIPPYKRLKSWVSINVEPGKNGLLVVPKSHKEKDIKWETFEKDGKRKPRLKSQINKNDLNLLITKNNTVIIFDDELIHGGAKNNGSSTRVSLEFTLFLKSQ